MSKRMKVTIAVLSVIVLGIGFLFANSLLGNPVSKMVAKNSGQKYLEETYSGKDFVIDDVFYNFKDGAYNVNVVSPSSIDTHFHLTIPFSKVAYDSYEDDVESNWNTYLRIDEEYRKMVDDFFSRNDFPIESDLDFGTIVIFEEEAADLIGEPDYGIKLAELEIDKVYDVKELAEEYGHIVYYVEDDEITFKNTSYYLRLIKEELDEAGLPFYAIDFVLQDPEKDTGRPYDDRASIHISHFRYEDIDENNLEELIEENHDQMMEYYKSEDEKMK